MYNSHHKAEYALKANVAAFIEQVGVEKIGFLTLTFGDHVTDWREGQKRFNSMMTNYGRKRFCRYVCVMEPQASGRIHYHLLVDCKTDIRTGVVFDEIRQKNYRSAGKDLRALWLELRTALKRYGFGRHELMPLRSNAQAVATYIGKYISKGALHRDKRFKGARWVRYSKGWRVATCRFTWNSKRGWCYRQKLKDYSRISGLVYSDMKLMFGPKWAYQIQGLLAGETVSEYPDPSYMNADGLGWIVQNMPDHVRDDAILIKVNQSMGSNVSHHRLRTRSAGEQYE